MVGEDAVGDAGLDEVGRDVGFAGVDEPRDDVVLAIQLGDGAKLVLVEEPLYKGTVELLADPPVLAVDEIVDTVAIGAFDAAEIAEHIVVIGRGEGAVGLGGEIPVRGVGVGRALVLEEPVLGIVVGNFEAVHVGAVAVRVVAVGGESPTVLFHLREPTCEVIIIRVGAGYPTEDLCLLGDAPEPIASVGDGEKRCGIEFSTVIGDLTEAVVGVTIGEAPERRAGQ